MKKIILISDGWRRLVTYAWVAGIMREIRKRDLDIALYQYNSYGNWSKDALHNIGEYNIYNLPDYQSVAEHVLPIALLGRFGRFIEDSTVHCIFR